MQNSLVSIVVTLFNDFMTDGGLIKICLLSYKRYIFCLVSIKWLISGGGGVGDGNSAHRGDHRPRGRMSESQGAPLPPSSVP